MIAVVTSIGEVTTDLCIWSLERNGFKVMLVYNETSSLAQKLEYIYGKLDEDFLRVDADVVPNKKCRPDMKTLDWWTQYLTYDWHKQDLTNGGVQFIKKEALPALRANVKRFIDADRPETELSRIEEFYNPRRFDTLPEVMGIVGYRARDVGRIKQTKMNRKYYDTYDWELAERLEAL